MKKAVNVIIYQNKLGALEFKGDFKNETIWASQAQIASIFDVERSVVTKHINNILKDKELDKKTVCAIFAHTAEDKKTYQVQNYNLDVILAVGYRTNSAKAIQFRQWATKTLREHLTKGFTINRKQISKNYNIFIKAVENVEKLLSRERKLETEDVLELIKSFASTWLSLDSYDKEKLPQKGATKKNVKITAGQIGEALKKLRNELIRKKEASDLFGQERISGSFEGIIGSIYQVFNGLDLYPTMEQKAAYLLYFVVKNHPFVDGNKRSGAFSFIWFLQKAKILNPKKITPEALTALTLLVAESDPRDKERIIGLILIILGK